MKLLIKRNVYNKIDKISGYIVDDIKMPLTAIHFTERLLNFALKIGKQPLIFPLCKNRKFAQRHLRCAIFEKKWIFVYSVGERFVIIHYLLWGGAVK